MPSFMPRKKHKVGQLALVQPKCRAFCTQDDARIAFGKFYADSPLFHPCRLKLPCGLLPAGGLRFFDGDYVEPSLLSRSCWSSCGTTSAKEDGNIKVLQIKRIMKHKMLAIAFLSAERQSRPRPRRRKPS